MLESELKYATVLFGDVVASTELVAGRSPEEARSILAPAVAGMVEAAEAFGGTVVHVLGDGIMALFGVPVSQEDHALRACCAAARMHEAAAALRSPHRLRIGLASGQMLLGGLEAGAYQAFGATIHLASRLQALARPGTTLCDDATRTLAGPSIGFAEMGSHALRGFSVEQPVFALAEAALGPSGFRRSAQRDLSPFVGRDQELAELAGWAREVAAGGSLSGTIIGEAGLGKSRLAWEFIGSLDPAAWQVIRAEAVSYGRDVPYHFVGTLLRACFGLEVRPEPAQAVDRIRGRLRELEGASECGPAVLSLLSLPLGPDAAVWDRLDPMRRREALRDRLRSLLHALCRRRLTLLLLEDLQWVDEESLWLLDLPPAPGSRLLLLTTQRPGFGTGWSRAVDRVIHLGPLSADSAARLVERAFPWLGAPDRRRALVERAAGNPFFLEELARDARTSLPQRGPSMAVPATIQAVIAARIDRLPAEDKKLLMMAAVLGSRFPRRTLRAMFGDTPGTAFDDRLARLLGTELLQPLDRSDTELAFSHALIQDVAYAALPITQRHDLHRQIVQTMLRIDRERLSEQAETLAYHAALGACWEELVPAATIAGRRAASRWAYAEAARFFSQAIEACAGLPETPETLATQIDLRFEMRQAIGVTALINRSLDNSKKALRLARRLGDARRLGWATAFVARDLQLVGKPVGAIKVAARAFAFAAYDPELEVAVRYYSSQAHYSRGDYARAAEMLRALIADSEQGRLAPCRAIPGLPVVFFENWLTWSLARMGEHDAALLTARDMRQRADAAALPLCRMLARLSEGFALAFAGHLTDAEEALEASLALCREWGFVAWSTNVASCLGHVLARLGRFDEAFEQLGQAIEVTRQSGILVSHANELAWLAEAELLRGRAAEAAAIAEGAVAVARQHQERGNEALAGLVLVEALLARGEAAPARFHAAAAMRLAEESGMAPLAERCRAVLHATNPDCPGAAMALDSVGP